MKYTTKVDNEEKNIATCFDECGNGRRIHNQCDDGNLVDEDGCSSECEVEENFECVNGTAETKDVCFDSRKFIASLVTDMFDPTQVIL